MNSAKIPQEVVDSVKAGVVPDGYVLTCFGTDKIDPMHKVLMKHDSYYIELKSNKRFNELGSLWGSSFSKLSETAVAVLSKEDREAGMVIFIGQTHEVMEYIQARVKGDHLCVGLMRVGGFRKTVVTGRSGISVSDVDGTSKTGFYGVAYAGLRGMASAGEGGVLLLEYVVMENDIPKRRVKVGYIGEDGLQPNVLYQLNKDNEFEEVK